MKRNLLLSLLAGLCAVTGGAVETIDKLEAFPGAEGYGRYTTGGRGGKVYHVTTLEDNDQPGSLRYACSQSGARTIVFDVSGNIHLKSALQLNSGNVTIAGQTAPGDGICISDYPFSIKANNVIIRFVRFRLGNKNVTVNGADGWDGLGSLDQKNIIVDHCSVSWSIDECLSFSGTSNTTVQWCIVSQSLVNSGHSKGGHGYGGNWGGEYGSYHHNLIAHHTSRTPRLGPRPSTQLKEYMDMRNNVMFNYGGNSCYGGEGMNVNIVNNYYKPGPGNNYSGKNKETRIAGIGVRTLDYCLDKNNTASNYNKVFGTSISGSSINGFCSNGKNYIKIAGKNYQLSEDKKTITVNDKEVKVAWNTYGPALHLVGSYYVDGNDNYNVKSVINDNWNLGMYNQMDRFEFCATEADWNNVKQDMKRDLPIEYIYTTTHTADKAYEKVLSYAGASLKRDALDAMIINDAKSNVAKSGTGSGLDAGFINTPDDVAKCYPEGTELDGYLPALKSTEAPKDTDGDGMPDEWETANGLDPNDANDGKKASASGYTNLELYMNSLVQSIMDAGNAEGKMLNGELTYADDAVELPVYKPEETPDQPGDNTPAETYEWLISAATGDEAGMVHKESSLPFKFGTEISVDCNNASRKYNHGSSGTRDHIKFASSNTWTITLPEGKVATELTFEGWANKDDQTSYISSVNDDNFEASQYVFPPRTESESKSYTITLSQPANAINVIFGNVESVLRITIKGKTGQSGIEDIIADDANTGNGRIYNLMGIEMREPLQPGIYIRDGKKFIVK